MDQNLINNQSRMNFNFNDQVNIFNNLIFLGTKQKLDESKPL